MVKGPSRQVVVRFPTDQYEILCAILETEKLSTKSKGTEVDMSKLVRELVVTSPKYIKQTKLK